MLNPSEKIHRWLCSPSSEPPAHVRAAIRQVGRHEDAAAQHYIDWSSEDLEKFLAIVDQQRLEFDEEDTHANVRQAVARYLELEVLPSNDDPRLHKMPARLREARQTGVIMYRKEDQKIITMWDTKAGVPLLCPDDSREEGMRVARRYIPTIAAWRNGGKAVHKLVLNPPNIPRGELRQGMRDLFKTFNQRFLKSGQFPEIKGALVTLEAPLSVRRNWNVHLNVILLCDGYLDYNKIVSAWGHQFDAYRLRGDEDQIAAVLREVIKYAAQAMPSKSAEHKRRGISEAPALTEWTGDEFSEWWAAHQRFRRTRSYGLLFDLDEPEPDEPESMEGFGAIGQVRHDGTRLVRTFTLLESIPGDKSTTTSLLDRYRRAIQQLRGPPDEARRAIELTAQAMQAWAQVKNQLQ